MHHKLTLFKKKIPSVLLSKMVQEFQVLHYLLLERLEMTLIISILVGVVFFFLRRGMSLNIEIRYDGRSHWRI